MEDPIASAKSAGLRYVSDQDPGFTRKRVGKSFTYLDASGATLKDREVVDRIQHIGIPPAWTKVWICKLENGHIQATGRDARGRKQYRYHVKWREVRDETKYHRLISFARALPKIRKQTESDLALPGLAHEKVLATVVRLLEATLIRVGNEEYARDNESYGLTTLHNEHVEVAGATLRFRFRGKSGKHHAIAVHDRRLAKIVERCGELPGEELFQWVDDAGELRPIDSQDVNDYIRAIAGDEFTAKDFRTWAGTILAARALQELERFDGATQAKKNVMTAIERVSEKLGNTKTVCRKCYVHPEIISAYLDGSMLDGLAQRAKHTMAEDLRELKPEEAMVVAFLEERLAREKESLASKLKRSVAGTRAGKRVAKKAA